MRHAAGQGLLLAATPLWILTAAVPDESIAVCEEWIADMRRGGSLVPLAVVHIYRGAAWLRCGDLAEAETDFREALRLAALAGASVGTVSFSAFLAESLLEQGRTDEAIAVLDTVQVPTPLPAVGQWFSPLRARARVWRAQGRHQEALQAALAAGQRYAEHAGGCNPAIVAWRSEAALCLHALGRVEEARRYAAEEVELARRWGAAYATGRALRVAGLVTPGPAGRGLLKEAVSLLQPSTARLEYAKALIDLGAALRRGNNRLAARTHLTEGLDLAYHCGAGALVDQARTELRAAGARPRRPAATGPDALTPSERRVADLAAHDLTNRQIAQQLFVTVKTVEVHLSAIYRKLGITRRSQLRTSLATPDRLAPARSAGTVHASPYGPGITPET
jgi:ATP/maltotriose-dependent transcriptional regulator MalT